MKFLGTVLAIAAVAAATPIEFEERAAPNLSAQVLGNLTEAGNDIVASNNTLNSFGNNDKNIPFVTLVALQNKNTEIQYDVGNATKSSNQSSKFNQAQSKSIADKVTSLKPQIFSLLDNYVRHKPAFKNQGVAQVVLQGLQAQRELVREQGGSLQKKLVPAYAKYAPGNTTQILNAFDKAIKAFQS